VRRVVVAPALLLAPAAFGAAPLAHAFRIARVIDGDTVALTNGARVRLVQIDTPEVYFGLEWWGRQASAETKKLLPPGTFVRLASEPATDSVDRYGRLLRYLIRVRDGRNVNVFLVKHGDAAPHFYRRRDGRYARTLKHAALRARLLHRGLWGACRRTPLDFAPGSPYGLIRGKRAGAMTCDNTGLSRIHTLAVPFAPTNNSRSKITTLSG
jgi:endonuclease YncB( thermonuclease family)